MIYEILKHDMNAALKSGEKLRRLTLADIVSTIDKTATAGAQRVEITDELANEALLKYRKTVQEMIDTCPDTEQYANKKAEYIAKLAIVNEYAPKVITDIAEITRLIISYCQDNEIFIRNKNEVNAAKRVLMPYLKSCNCDMKIAQQALSSFAD